MLLVDIERVSQGMVLARPVFNSERSAQPILQTGSELPPALINRLREMGLRSVWIKQQLDVPQTDAPAETRGQQSDESIVRVGELIAELRTQFRRAIARGPSEIRISALTDCIQALASGMSHQVSHEPPILQLSWLGHDLATHLANTTYYALLIATHLPRYVREQRNTSSAELWTAINQIGLAATLHDIGKLFTEQKNRVHNLTGTPNELAFDAADSEYLKHPLVGSDALRTKLHSTIGYVIANHHQRFNGKGFPQTGNSKYADGPMMGTRIHIFARIVALANTIDHVLGRDLRPHDPIQRLQELAALQPTGRFDPLLLHSALRLIPAVPEGAPVRLSDGRLAVIARNNAHHPCEPIVRKLDTEDRPPLESAGTIDLSKNTSLKIVEVAGTDVTPYLYTAGKLNPDPLNYWALRDVLSNVPRIRLKIHQRQLAAANG
jgi:HD-GYP domain-containing protein (c-di-GMP phosphodiesterase class II)